MSESQPIKHPHNYHSKSNISLHDSCSTMLVIQTQDRTKTIHGYHYYVIYTYPSFLDATPLPYSTKKSSNTLTILSFLTALSLSLSLSMPSLLNTISANTLA